MPNPVKRLPLSEQIFQQLRDEILNRGYQPGERLPAERELCKLMHVTRGPMREALKRLEQARLVEIRQGDGTIVLDYETHGGMELLPALAMPTGRPNFDAIRSMFECRSLIAPEMARLAATRIGPPDLEQLTEIVDRIEASDEPAMVQELDLVFHGVVARASSNLVYRLIYNTTRDLYQRFKELLVVMFDPEQTRSLYRVIRDAIAAGDERGAQARCAELVDFGKRRAEAVIDQFASQGGMVP